MIGQYFAAMYPDKIGRVALDSVLDGNDYRALYYLGLDDMDAILESFFAFCHQAGPAKCIFYDATATKIQVRFQHSLQNLSEAPIPLPFAQPGPMVFTKKMMHQLLLTAAYKPISMFPIVADTLVAIETQNATTLSHITASYLSTDVECNCQETLPWIAQNEAASAISCGDGDDIVEGPRDFVEYFDKLSAQSAFAAPLMSQGFLGCDEWRLKAKWRYTGPFASDNTSYPLLIISTKYDPVGPLRHAKLVQQRYRGSRLLTQNSYGHSSVSSPSLCTAKHVRAYFVNGSLPEEGTVCEVDELPLVGDVDSGGHATQRVLSAEDAGLLSAFKALGDGVLTFGNL